uniref:Wound-responsive family protein n=1 Tax=Noccaea caerulescens TaxID=107243 RepID=A0A1J3F7N3_NOCCA
MNAGKQASWAVATAIAAVEVLKDQGVARWNYPLRLLHKHAMARVPTITVPSRPSPPPSSSSSSAGFIRSKQTMTTSYEKAVELSCFGPTTVRF